MKTAHSPASPDRTMRLPLLWILLLFLWNTTSLQGQFFEESIAPAATVHEDAWDGMQIPGTPNFVTLSNTTAYGHNLLALTILDPAGNILQRSVVWDVPNPGSTVFGASLDVDLDASGVPQGFYITGARMYNGISEMIVIHTNMAGFPTWVQSLPVFSSAGTIQYYDAGVSVERQPNGDVIAIGKSTDLSTGIGEMIAARFTPAGIMVWSNRYRHGSLVGSLVPAESCNGNGGNPAVPVVAVTGAFVTGPAPGNMHTFGSCINAATGAEIWRSTYNSGLFIDEGLDIVQKPTNGPFMIVGQATSTAGGISLWIVNAVPTSGALVAGSPAYYTANGDLIGRDVCLNAAGNRAIIAGLFRRQVAGSITNLAFLMQISFQGCANPNWTRSYLGSSPHPQGTESVNRVGAPNVPGYLLTTDALPQSWGGATYGNHPIYVDVNGFHTYTGDCPILAFSTTRTCAGTRTQLQRVRTPFPWMPIQLNWEILTNTVAACDGVPPAPLTGFEDRDQSLTVIEPGLSVYPNPVNVGEDLRMIHDGNLGEINLSLFDLNGRKWWEKQWEIADESESSVLIIPTASLPSGTYVLHLQTGDRVRAVKVVVH